LNVLSVQVPPLRERTEDIGLLAAHFLRCHRPRNQPAAVRLSPAALLKLEAYDWPGNVRELEAVIQRAIVLTRSPTVGAADIDLPVDISEVHDQPLRLNEAKRMVIGRFEKAYLIGLLSANHGNLSHAAREAGKERRAFQRLVRKHKLDRAQFREVR
jgi:two-component system response regulator GlrR